MSAIKTCFLSAKGGSGKTVTSSALATFLSALGFHVLLVDTDAATNGMTLLYLEQLLGRRKESQQSSSRSVGLFDFISETDDQDGFLATERLPTQIVISENLHFVPATYRMIDTEHADPAVFRAVLKALLNQQIPPYDFIFLDAQAGTDKFAKIAAAAADQCVIVSEYDPVSAEGVERLKLMFADEIRPSSTWTLFNKILPEFATIIGHGLAVARYLPPVPWDADVVRAFARRDLAVNISAPNAYTLALSEVAYYLFRDEAGSAIEKWREKAYQEVVSPAEKQLRQVQEAEDRLTAAIRRQAKLSEFFAALTGVVLSGISMTLLLGGVSAKGIFGNLTSYRVLFATVLLLLGVLSVTSVVLIKAWRSSRERDDASLALVRTEQTKLRAILDGAKALKVSEGAGYYELRRRRPPPAPKA